MNNNKTVINGLKCYLWITILYALYSTILDKIFIQIQYNINPRYGILKSFFSYGIYFITVCFPIAIPLSIFYNWLIVNGAIKIFKKNIVRILFGFFVGLIVGLSFGEGSYSFYIGYFRSMKNIFLFALIGLSVEIIRTLLTKKTKAIIKNTDYDESISGT